MVPELVRITDKTGLTNYTTQAYRDHETFLISNKVRNLAKKYEKLEHKSFTNTMLKSYVGLSEAIVKVRQYVPVDTPTTLEQKEIYAIALSGLLTEFSQGIIKQGVKYEYENEEEINRNPILKYLNNVKKLHDLGKEPYNFANHYGQNTWTKSFYYNKIGHGPNETFVFNFDSKFGFNNLIKEIPNKIENQEGYNMDEIKEFNEIINQIVKESFINFDARLPIDDIQNWTNWVFEVDNQANNKNEWLEYVNISIGARMYQTAFIKAINSPINLPLPNKNKDNSYPYTLDEYYEKVRVQLYANPWTMFDTILTSNYYGGDILGNKIAMTSMNQPWINDEIILKKNTAKPKKDEGDIFNSIDDGFAIELEIKGKIFNPFLAIGVYALIFIILIMVSYLTFRKTMKK
ncbi:hypothetical protein [Williamsoniiplasma lucivorax]|nr:hypothetical protein [Williamsoniiplasma lucivorax]